MARKQKFATQRQYQPYIDRIMEDLDLIGKVSIDFIFRNYSRLSADAQLFGSKNNAPIIPWGTIRISSNQSKKWTIETLMHELRHIKQMYEGWLCSAIIEKQWGKRIIRTWGSEWKGTKQQDYSYAFQRWHKDHQKYMDMPWEVDARDYEKEIYRLFPGLRAPKQKKLVGVVGGVKFYKTGT